MDRLLADEGPEDAISQDYFASADTYLETPRADRAAPSRMEIPQHPADEVGRVTAALDRLSARIEAAEHRSTLAISGVDQTVRGMLQRLDAAEREQNAVAARFEGAVQEVQFEQARAADRMRRIEAEAAGPRSAEALRSLESALGKVAGHLYDGEGRTREALAEMRQRVDRFEADRGEGVVEAVVSRLGQRLEQAEAKTSGALNDLRASFAALDDRLSSVEGQGAAPATAAMEARLETLAANLTTRMEAARAEMAERLRVTADTRFDRMDRTLAEMSEHVRAAEQRSAQAIEKMGREVIDMAEKLGRRVESVEHRSADAIEQVGGEVARIAHAVEAKLNRADTVQAQALEKLGGEIARISERLAERISNSERRSAQAIDDVGEQVARVTERISQRHERTHSELADRIRQSEERTAKLLEEAREKLEKLAADSQRRAPDVRRNAYEEDESLFEEDFPPFQPPPPAEGAYAAPTYRQTVSSQVSYSPAAATAAISDAWTQSPEPAAAFSDEDFVAADAVFAEPDADLRAAEAARLIAEAPVAELPAAISEADFAPIETVEAAPVAAHVAPEPPVAAVAAPVVAAAPVAEPVAELLLAPAEEPLAPFDFSEDEPVQAAAPVEPQFVEPAPVAPVAAEAVAEPLLEAPEPAPAVVAATDEDLFAEPAPLAAEAEPAISTREAVERARAAARAAIGPARPAPAAPVAQDDDTLFTGAPFGKRARPRFGAGQVVGLGLAAGFVVAAAGGYTLLQSEPNKGLGKSLADALDNVRQTVGGKAGGPAAAPAAGPQLAVALAPRPLDQQGAGMPPATAPAQDNLAQAYSSAVARIEAKDNTGLADLRKAANMGYAPAQFYLGKLYDGGLAGLKKDPAEARRWTERAAEGGDRKAMHNIGLAYFEGTGGPTNRAIAVQWFQKAAELGVIDSQVNLARIYEGGFGVPQNAAEAYKWYLIAAKSGDAESRTSATRVRDGLSADARLTAERAAAAFRSSAPNASTLPSIQASLPAAAPAPAAPVGNDMVTAQRALSALGYYQGPTDGSSSPAIRLALSAYQHDQGLPASGQADPATVARLSAYVR
ncbi:peptidoglycan-binding protein [Caulobacter sp. KR2-114]|uniref:peptidoglycan-binding protein n=1 Tax=Caulobacter sp. KR2-114 TaxID=3400912 RepID=UPI003C0E69E0